MATSTPTTDIDARFSSPGATPRPWSEVENVLERAEMFWLTTVRADGRPHVVPLPAMWLDGALHFCTGADEQKARNIEHDAACVLATGTNTFLSGLDVAVEGRATQVTDLARLELLAALWKAKLDWTFEPVAGGFRDRSPGVPDDSAVALVYAVAPTKVLAFGKGEPFSQTRYRFA